VIRRLRLCIVRYAYDICLLNYIVKVYHNLRLMTKSKKSATPIPSSNGVQFEFDI